MSTDDTLVSSMTSSGGSVTRVADDAARGRRSTSTRMLAGFVRILVGPLDRVGRAVVVLADGRVVDEEAHRHARRRRRGVCTWATTRITPGTPVRPSGEVMRTVVPSLRCGRQQRSGAAASSRGGDCGESGHRRTRAGATL